MLKYILLGFLNYQPMTGYDLKTRIDDSTGHFWHAYHSQIYTTLRKLEEKGWLTSELFEDEAGPNKREYTLTDTGRDALHKWLRKSMTEANRPKEELLVRLFFSGQRDKAHVLDELRVQRALHQQKLMVYETIKLENHVPEAMQDDPRADREQFFWERTLNFGHRYEMMYLAWLDETIEAIDALP
ncbi:MAG: PadR family transcriptional regulator [Chloroflexota bacterium]